MKKTLFYISIIVSILYGASYLIITPFSEGAKLDRLNNVKIYTFKTWCGYESEMLSRFFRWNHVKSNEIYGNSYYPIGVFYILKKNDEKIKCNGIIEYLEGEVSDNIYLSLDKIDLPYSDLISIGNYYKNGILTHSRLIDYIYDVNKYHVSLINKKGSIEKTKEYDKDIKRLDRERLEAEQAKKNLIKKYPDMDMQ